MQQGGYGKSDDVCSDEIATLRLLLVCIAQAAGVIDYPIDDCNSEVQLLKWVRECDQDWQALATAIIQRIEQFELAEDVTIM